MDTYPKIGQFYQIVKLARAFPDIYGGVINYLGTVKLHGTNSGIRVEKDRLVPQSRNRELTIEEDNYGFAAWVAENEDELRFAIQFMGVDTGDTLYGEWIGAGIQSAVAISKLHVRQWVVYSSYCAGIGMADLSLLGAEQLPPAVHRKGEDGWGMWGMVPITMIEPYGIEVDLTDPASCSAALDRINKLTAEVEDDCPWGRLLGIPGIGEGIVWKPMDKPKGFTDEHEMTELYFKSKGGKHKGEERKAKPASMTAEQHASIDAFVVAHVNSERLKQGVDALREDGEPITMQSTGKFLDWIKADIKTEASDELEASGIPWNKALKAITVAAVKFWKTVAA